MLTRWLSQPNARDDGPPCRLEAYGRLEILIWILVTVGGE